MRIWVFTAVFSIHLFQLSYAFGDATSIVHALAPALTGVLGGRRYEGKQAKEVEDNKFTFGLFRHTEKDKGQMCSSIAIEGCLLTANHCDGDEAVDYFGGDHIDGKKDGTKVKSLKIAGKNGKKVDMTVIKVDPPISRDRSAPVSIIADTKPRPNEAIRVVGYGTRGTEEKEEMVSGEKYTTRVDIGHGTKRWGRVNVMNPKNILEEYKASIEKSMAANDVVYIERNPNLLGGGDSGGPAFELKEDEGVGKLYGINTYGFFGSASKMEVFFERNAEDTLYGAITPVAEHKEEIIAALKSLGCTAPVDATNELNSFLKKEFSKKSRAYKEWERDEKWQTGSSKLKQLKDFVRKVALKSSDYDPSVYRDPSVQISKDGNLLWTLNIKPEVQERWLREGRSFGSTRGSIPLPE